jgi:hypothetical protein
MAVDATTQLHYYNLLIGSENVPGATGEMFVTVSPTTKEPVGRMTKAVWKTSIAPLRPQGV